MRSIHGRGVKIDACNFPARIWAFVGVIVCGWLLCVGGSANAADGGEHEEWEVIYMANQRVGYARSHSTRVKRNDKTIIVTKQEQRISAKRFGDVTQLVMTSQTEEAEDGQLLSFQLEVKNPPAKPVKSRGELVGSTLRIESTIDDRTTTHSIEAPRDLKSLDYQQRILRERPMKPGETLKFTTFSLELSKIGTITIHADEPHVVKLHDGKSKSLLKLRVSNSLLPTADMRVYVDERGVALRSESTALGLTTYGVSRDVALQALSGAELDVAVSTLIRVPNPPATLIKAKKALLKISSSEIDLTNLIPNSAHQTVKTANKDSVELALKAVSIPRYVVGGPVKDRRYLAETQYLQTKDRRVQEHVERASSGSDDLGTTAARMERYVFEKLNKKNFSTALASAAEVAERLEGDCTEHACLLAAMLRVKQIPSRVAVGFVYADKIGAFAGHMWTEAFLDGQWIPLDGTLGMGSIGASHIKLADSDLGDVGPVPVASFLPVFNLVNQVKIEVVSHER